MKDGGQPGAEGKVHRRKELLFSCLTISVYRGKEPSKCPKGSEAMNTRPVGEESQDLRDSKDVKELGLRPRALQLESS